MGHAIEVRVNAEDPAGGRFLPSPGTLTRFDAPSGPGVRVDAGYASGDTVSQFYDNLICKIVTWGADREQARRRMLRALDETRDRGGRDDDPRRRGDPVAPRLRRVASTRRSGSRNGSTSSGVGSVRPVAAAPEDGRVRRTVTAEVDGRRYDVDLWLPAGGMGGAVATKPSRRASHAGVAGTGSGEVTVPMQGTVVKVLVAEGDEVEEGQTVCILEAMKMENTVASGKAGTVAELRVAAGDAVGAGDVVAVIE